MSPAPTATEVVFLPGFDGAAELRAEFVAAIGERHPARAIGYPNRRLESLNGYARHVAEQVAPQSRPLVIAESFSGLVAARWASRDPHVAGLILCGSFARSPVPWAAIGASLPSMAQFLGAHFLTPMTFASTDPARRRWSQALASAIRSLDRDVIAERLRLIAVEDVRSELAQLRIPIVLAHFEHDLVITPDARLELEAACRGAALVRLPGPHFAIETRPRESAEALRDHVDAFFAAGAARSGTR